MHFKPRESSYLQMILILRQFPHISSYLWRKYQVCSVINIKMIVMMVYSKRNLNKRCSAKYLLGTMMILKISTISPKLYKSLMSPSSLITCECYKTFACYQISTFLSKEVWWSKSLRFTRLISTKESWLSLSIQLRQVAVDWMSSRHLMLVYLWAL